MYFPILALIAVVLFLEWTRMSKVEALVDNLTARVRALEGLRDPVVAVPRPAPTPVVPVPRPTALQPAPMPIARRMAVPAPAPVPSSAESLETQIGARWLLYIGVVAIVIGISYFEKLAIDNRWIGETARTVQGGLVGFLLIYAGVRFARAGYALYGQVISGGGFAALYVSTYAAFNLYELINRPTAFLLMCAITALAAWQADRQRSPGLALMAVGGGFATPFLLPADLDAQVALFGYDAILIAGTMYLARRRAWPALNVVSYAFTAFTVSSWAGRFYTPSKYLTTELFLTLFCAMYLFILRETRRTSRADVGLAQGILWTAPAVYYVASIVILTGHSTALLVYLIALALVGAIVASRAASIARLIFWAAVATPLLLWVDGHASRTWLTAGLATVTAAYAIFLLAHLEWTRRDEFRLTPADIVLLHLNGLWAYGCAYLLIGAVHATATAPVAAAFAIWNGLLAFALANRNRDHALHAAALAFTLLMVAIALQFDGAWVTVGWAAEGAVVVALGLRERREWLRAGGALLLAVAIGRLIQLQFAPPPIDQLVLLNRRTACGAFVTALTYWLAWAHRGQNESDRRGMEVAAAVIVAQVLTLALLTSEIVAYWSIHDAGNSFLARGLMLSMTWALYATALIVAGIRIQYAPIRYFAMVMFAVTITKVFLVDLAELDRVYRILSIIGLGVTLLTTSYLYHRFRVTSPANTAQ